jgi:hypothetical protein
VDDATRAAARNLGDSGVAAYQAGDYALASEKLEKAYHLLHAPSLGLWSGRSLAQRGLWVEAAERYLEVTRLAVLEGEIATQRQAQVDAQAELEAIRSKIPSVVIDLEGAAAHDVKVHLDGAPIASDLIGEARPANPGRHELTGLRGSERVVLQLSLREGE